MDTYTARMEEFQIHAALEAVWAFVSRCDQLVETSAPWKLAKDPAQAARLDAVLYTPRRSRCASWPSSPRRSFQNPPPRSSRN